MQASLERLRERRREGSDEGFTLIELLIVIVILAILAAIVVFAVDAMTGSSARASCESDVQTVDHAVQAYIGQVATTPTSITQLETATTGSDGSQVGPWLHSTPNNGKHYDVVIANGTAVYNAWAKSGTPGTATAPPAGTVIVENFVNGVVQTTPDGTIYTTPSVPSGVVQGTVAGAAASDTIQTTPAAACGNVA